MENTTDFTTFEVINILLNATSIVILLILFVNVHTGDCRTTCLSKTKSPDGHFVTRKAKLSMQDVPLTNFNYLCDTIIAE